MPFSQGMPTTVGGVGGVGSVGSGGVCSTGSKSTSSLSEQENNTTVKSNKNKYLNMFFDLNFSDLVITELGIINCIATLE